MDALLNSILDNMAASASSAAPVIVSENHDVNSINWVQGLSDPGEMIACGYMPEIRRRANESDEVYQARITPIVMKLPLKQRQRIMGAAIGRAKLDESNGRIAVVVAGVPAWHGLGVNVAEALNRHDAMRLSSTGWEVEKRLMSIKLASGSFQEVDGTYAVTRKDTEAVLGVVGSRYTPIQNVEAFEFMDDVMAEFGARYHTAGAVHGGQKVWMQLELPNQSFDVVSGDSVQAFATFTNSHDGLSAAYCFPTIHRVVCNNTLRRAGSDRSKGLAIRHTKNVKKNIEAAREVLGIAVRETDHFKVEAAEMVATPCDAPLFFDELLEVALDLTKARQAAAHANHAGLLASIVEAKQKELEKLEAKKGTLLEDILTRYEGERCGIGGIRGSQWAALNAVTESADHRKLQREVGTPEERASRRYESIMTGDADDLKQTAFRMLADARNN